MRRDSTNLLTIKTLLLASFLVIYQIMTSLYLFLSPLIGLFFCYLVLLKQEEDKYMKELFYQKIFIMAYLVFAELNKGFYLFSSVLFLVVFYIVFVDWIKSSFKCRPCILTLYVAIAYVGIWATNNLFAYILNKNMYEIGFDYFIYIVTDAVLAVVLLRDKNV